MRIYDTPQQLPAVAAGKQAHRADTTSSGKTASQGTVAQTRGDEVQLSALASGETASSGGTSRDEKVEQLASIYGRGAYSVDADAVAASIIDDSTSMP